MHVMVHIDNPAGSVLCHVCPGQGNIFYRKDSNIASIACDYVRLTRLQVHVRLVGWLVDAATRM